MSKSRIPLHAQKLREADALHSNVRSRLRDAVADAHRGTGSWGDYVDHTGDGESGDVIYSSGGDLRKAPYELGSVGGKATANIDTDSSVSVVPVTTYQEEADDDDQYAAMSESMVKANLYTELPLYERFISKDERTKAADDSFAGKGKSFPILKPEDVGAAVHAMGRAGSGNYGMAQLKANITRIAKSKGWAKYLPKSWQDDSSDAKESKREGKPGSLKLAERFDWPKEQDATLLKLMESGGVRMPIKLIAPGKGSSAFYPAEVLKRDGPSVFKAGTHIYINHATQAEEAARPEGDWHKLAGALEGNAYYDENGKAGPGLYGTAVFTSDYAPLIKEKAPFTGMSIRASGIAEANRKQDGVPVLKEFTHAESIDVVTRAGAGGMILTESQRSGNEETEMMDAKQIQDLIEAGVAKAVGPLRNRALRGDAIVVATTELKGYGLRESAKQLVIDNLIERELPMKDNELDTEKFKTLVTAEAKRVAAAIGEDLSAVRLGPSGTVMPVTESAEDIERKRMLRKEAKRRNKELAAESVDVFESLGMPKNAAAMAANGRV